MTTRGSWIVWDKEGPGWLLYDGETTTTFRQDAAKFTDVGRFLSNERYQVYPASHDVDEDTNVTKQGEGK